MKPLNLPQGSVRALIALALTFVVCYLLIMQKEIPAGIYAIWVSALAYYLGLRTPTNLTP